MKTRVGLGLSHDAVRAVAVTARGVSWAVEAVIEQSDRGLEETITHVLAKAPLPPWSRPVLSAAVGPQASQVKVVAGLPQSADASTLAAIIREGVGSFFLKNGVPLVTTAVRPVGPGEAWVGALDRPVVEAVREACRARGWRLGVIAPAAVTLPFAIQDAAFRWTDGNILLEANHANRTLTAVRTRPTWAMEQETARPSPVPELAALGDDAIRFADAYGAAALAPGEPLALDAAAAGWWTGRAVRRRFLPPATVFLLATVTLITSPLASRWAERQARAQIGQVRPEQWGAIDSARAQLDRVTRVLAATSRFAASGVGVTDLLAQLARTLPDSNVLVMIDLDGTRAQALILTRQPAATLAAARALPGLASAELASDPNGGIALPGFERVVLRFQFRPPQPAPSGRPR